MAHIETQLTSLGSEGKCQNCPRLFSRGERMNAVASDDGEPMGWYCDACIEKWKQGKLVPDEASDSRAVETAKVAQD